MDVRPEINDPVVLRDADQREYRSRVEDLEAGLVTVARPLDLRADGGPGPDDEITLSWPTPRGIAVLPARMVAAHREGKVPLWTLAIAGNGWIEQQREYVRIPASGRVELQPQAEDSEIAAVTGHLVDLSEAALRCAVEPDVAADLVAGQVEVHADFHFGDRGFAVPARVTFRRSTIRPDGRVEVIVLFDASFTDADALRKEIFGHQIRALRTKDDDR